MFLVIKQKFLTYKYRMLHASFERWKKQTAFSHKESEQIQILGNVNLQEMQEKNNALKKVVVEKRKELEEIQKENKAVEEKGKAEFKEKAKLTQLMSKRQGISLVTTILKNKVLR